MIDHTPYRSKHDLGGTDAGELNLTTHEPTDFDRRVDALVNLLAHPSCGLVGPDERRLGIEELSSEEYFSLPYYGRWLKGVVNILTKKGILTPAEIEARIDQLRQK